MSTHRISVDIDEDEHKYLKMCCARLGMTIKEFVVKATIEKVDSWEDTWMLERWEKDGTLEQLEKDRNNPDRKLYEINFNGDECLFTETTYRDVERKANGL